MGEEEDGEGRGRLMREAADISQHPPQLLFQDGAILPLVLESRAPKAQTTQRLR